MASSGTRMIINVVVVVHLLITFTATTFSVAARSDNPTSVLLSELESLRSQSHHNGGVIHLNDDLLKRILSLPTPRPFSFLLFFDAKRLHSKPELSLPTLKSEFSIVSNSFLENNNNDDDRNKLFFFEIEFQESQSTFTRFAVNSVPNIKLVPNSAADAVRASIQMDASVYTGSAESMAEFIESHTKFIVTPIHRPSVISKIQTIFAIAVLSMCIPYVVKRLLSGKTLLLNKNLWLTGAVLVYFFSVSGVMHYIIRQMPMFLVDREDSGRLIFFYQGSGTQLGAEGFAVGFLFTAAGLLLAFVTHALFACTESKKLQTMVMIFVLVILLWAVEVVVSLANWKIRYRSHSYWPSSWK